jgi:hypothetical protein
MEFGADYRSKINREQTAKVLAQAIIEFTQEYLQAENELISR